MIATGFYATTCEWYETDYVIISDMYWTSPELLRMSSPPRCGTQKGDVYSFAIIVKEILFRNEPFAEYEDLTPVGNYLFNSHKLSSV